MRLAICAATVLLLLFSSSGVAEPVADGRARFELVKSDGVTRIRVEIDGPDGETLRHVLRETLDPVVLRESGQGPSGRAAFATWDEANDAADYRVYRSAMADAGFGVVAQPPEPVYEDPGALADSQNWFYLFTAADACGNESSE